MEIINNLAKSDFFRPAFAFLIALFALFVGLFIRSIIFRIIYKASRKTRVKVDDIIVDAIKYPSFLWTLIFAIYIGTQYLTGIPENWSIIINKTLLALVIISVTWVLANAVSNLVNTYAKKTIPTLAEAKFTRNLIKIVILVIGALVLLDSLGIHITALITALGVGSLAVALALQDTLSNFFAGLHILIDKPVRLGQFVKLASGEEGYIHEIGWRTTRIRMLPNNIVVIPNSKLVNTIVTNYYYPEKEMAVLVQVGVDYKSDLEHVERVTCEVAKEIMQKINGGVAEFKPFIRYHTFDDFSINFTVILRAKEFVDNYLIKHEFIKALHKRYNEEGIVIPFPIRTVHMEK